MKRLHLAFATLAIGVASISSVQAHDSISFGFNVGSPHYYQPPVQYYSAPPAVVYYPNPPVYYYGAPRVYNYQPAPTYYYPQAAIGWNNGWQQHRWHEHEEHERRRHHRWYDDD